MRQHRARRRRDGRRTTRSGCSLLGVLALRRAVVGEPHARPAVPAPVQRRLVAAQPIIVAVLTLMRGAHASNANGANDETRDDAYTTAVDEAERPHRGQRRQGQREPRADQPRVRRRVRGRPADDGRSSRDRRGQRPRRGRSAVGGLPSTRTRRSATSTTTATGTPRRRPRHRHRARRAHRPPRRGRRHRRRGGRQRRHRRHRRLPQRLACSHRADRAHAARRARSPLAPIAWGIDQRRREYC